MWSENWQNRGAGTGGQIVAFLAKNELIETGSDGFRKKGAGRPAVLYLSGGLPRPGFRAILGGLRGGRRQRILARADLGGGP